MKLAASNLIAPLALALSSSLLWVVSAFGQPEPFGKRLPSDSSPDAVEAVRQIEAAVGLDVERQVLLRPYEETSLITLVDGLDSPFDEVKAAVLDLLALAVEQLDIPGDILRRTVLPAISAVEDRYRSAPAPEEARLAELARRVLWHARVKAMTSDQERIQFLRGQLDNREDGYYYPFEAIKYLVALGNQDSKVVLENKLAESQRQSLSEKLLRQVRMAQREVEIQIHLRGSDAATQAAELKEAFLGSRADRSFAGQDFRVWLIRQMVDRDLKVLDALLSEAAADVTLEPRARYEAEQAVRQLRDLPLRDTRELPN